MSFLLEQCTIHELVSPEDITGFSCGDDDLDNFFANDCFAYSRQLLGKTYCYRLDSDAKTIVCAFTIVDAYNNAITKDFYERNGFKTVFSTDEQEKAYRHISDSAYLSTRLMYFDLMSLIQNI